ncbi:MAG: hypothetical protein ACXVCY_06420 [Pseudobdellovibrionaceae bacterium]
MNLLTGRSLWIHYFLFFSGSLVLIYQSYDLKIVGDSVNFLCVLFFVNSFFSKNILHVFENSVLMTFGYILPLLIRNSLKLTYIEAPSIQQFLRLAMMSTITTAAFGVLFSSLGFMTIGLLKKIKKISRNKVTTRSLNN